MAFNLLQKKLLDDFLYFPFSNICEEGLLSDEEQLLAFFSLIDDTVFANIKHHLLTDKNILDDVMQIRAIFAHPCPQNRSTGDYMSVGQEEGYAAWLDYDELLPCIVNNLPVIDVSGKVQVKPALKKEPVGLLSLTAKNDKPNKSPCTEPVTKEDVDSYIKAKVMDEIERIYFDNDMEERRKSLPFLNNFPIDTRERLILCIIFLYFKQETSILVKYIPDLSNYQLNLKKLFNLIHIANKLDQFFSATQQTHVNWPKVLNECFNEFVFIMKHKNFFLRLINEQGATLEGLALLGLHKLLALKFRPGTIQEFSTKIWKDKSIPCDLTFGFLTHKDMRKFCKSNNNVDSRLYQKVHKSFQTFKANVVTEAVIGNDADNNNHHEPNIPLKASSGRS